MKKLLFVFIFIFAIFANAEILNTATQCNNGSFSSNSASSSSSSTSSASGYNLPEIPSASCALAATHIAPGFDLSATASNPSDFDSGYLVNLSGIGNGIRIRFVVYEDEREYNAIQALVQTAYATRAPIHVVFENPTVNVLDYATYVNLRKIGNQGKTCYTVPDLNNQVKVLYCPIKGINLEKN